MTLPSQFSLEEENFYKDIQDLLKNVSQNEKELSLFLQRYMDLLAKADLDDESFIINFTKAGLIIEASAKVYGTKVDRLWNNLEHILLSLRSKSHGQSKNKSMVAEEMEMEGDESRRRLSVNCKRRKKVGDAMVSADDFVEIDNITGLLGKNMNESVSSSGNLKFCEKVPNMFIKNKQRKNKIDVCLNKNVEDKDTIRLRDWIISTECLLIKEIYTSIPEDNSTINDKNESLDVRHQEFDAIASSRNCTSEESERGEKDVDTSRIELVHSDASKEVEKGKSVNAERSSEKSMREQNAEGYVSLLDKDTSFSKGIDYDENDLNISKESDLAKFPNVLNRGHKAYLVDVDEVFWDTEKFQDMIPSKKLKSGKTYKTSNPPCKLCKRKEAHQGKKPGKRCINKKRKDSSLDLYFIPHVQPTIGEPQFGILPDEELISTLKQENKIIERLTKLNAARNINEAFHPDENPSELKNFLGFDGFEKRFIRLSECNEDEMEVDFEDNNVDEDPNFMDNPPAGNDFELPVPVIDDTVKHKTMRSDGVPEPKDDDRLAESEYQKLVKEGLKDHFEAKSIFAKNKELGIKISKWHEMISDKIKLSEKRGAMNMKSLANKIIMSFPHPVDSERPQMPFRQLVENQSRRDVPRYFFGCLQLTNERILEITKTDPRPLAKDCVMLTLLTSTRKNCDLDETTVKTPTTGTNAPGVNRKRDSRTRSPTRSENKSSNETKRLKQRNENTNKRQKNFTAQKKSKKISTKLKQIFEPDIKQATEQSECEKEVCETIPLHEAKKRKAEIPKRPPKKATTFASDLFQEIDVSTVLSENNVNERPTKGLEKLKFCDNVFKEFVKNKIKKKRKKNVGNENVVRLRDWIITSKCQIVEEIGATTTEHNYSENEKYGEKVTFTKKGIIQTKTQSGMKESALAEPSYSTGGREITIIQSHTYVKKPYSNWRCERDIPVKELKSQFSRGVVGRDYDPGPSNMNSVIRTIGTVCKRQENFTAPDHPKKRF